MADNNKLGNLDITGGGTNRPIIPIRDINQRIVEGTTTFVQAPTEFVSSFPKNTGQPSVANVNSWMTKNTQPWEISYFKDGQPGQLIHLLGDGMTTIVHNPGMIYTPTMANVLLLNHVCYAFKLFQIAPNTLQWSMVSQ